MPKTQTQTRQHETQITLPATPEQVWRAITEASSVEAWYAPEVRIDPRVGGEYFISWGGGMEGHSTIEIFEPGKHLRTVFDRMGAPMALDFYLESSEGSTTLRLVHTGFLSSAEWDAEYDGTYQGWAIMFRILRYGLMMHPGVAGRQQWLYAKAAEPQQAAWKRVTAWFTGLSPVYEKEPDEFAAATSEFGEGLIYAAFGEKAGTTGVSLHVVLYGEAIKRLDEAAAYWKARIEDVPPAS